MKIKTNVATMRITLSGHEARVLSDALTHLSKSDRRHQRTLQRIKERIDKSRNRKKWVVAVPLACASASIGMATPYVARRRRQQ